MLLRKADFQYNKPTLAKFQTGNVWVGVRLILEQLRVVEADIQANFFLARKCRPPGQAGRRHADIRLRSELPGNQWEQRSPSKGH